MTIWDSLANTPEEGPLAVAQREELDHRLDEMEQDGNQGIPWEKVLRRLRGRSDAERAAL